MSESDREQLRQIEQEAIGKAKKTTGQHREGFITIAAKARMLLRQTGDLSKEELAQFKAKITRKSWKPGPSVTFPQETDFIKSVMDRATPKPKLSEEAIRKIQEQNKIDYEKASREQQERLRKEREADAIKHITITADNRTFDMGCPVCCRKVVKKPQVTAVSYQIPVCDSCLEKHKPKLAEALKKFHEKYPDLPNCDFRKAILELEKATGLDIRVPVPEYGIRSQPGELVL